MAYYGGHTYKEVSRVQALDMYSTMQINTEKCTKCQGECLKWDPVPKTNVSGQRHTVGSGYSPKVHTKVNWSRNFWIVRAASLLLIKVLEKKNKWFKQRKTGFSQSEWGYMVHSVGGSSVFFFLANFQLPEVR